MSDLSFRVSYRADQVKRTLVATPARPALRSDASSASPSHLLLAIIRATPDLSVQLDQSLAVLSTTELRAAVPYIRVEDLSRRTRVGCIRSWITRVASLRVHASIDEGTLLNATLPIWHCLIKDTKHAQLDTPWSQLSDDVALAADIALALALQPRALLLDGRAPYDLFETRVLSVAARAGVPLVWDSCSPQTASRTSASSFTPLHAPLRCIAPPTPVHRVAPTSSGWRIPAVVAVLAMAAGTAVADGGATADAFRVVVRAMAGGAAHIPWWRIATLGGVLATVMAASVYLQLDIATRVGVSAVRCFVQLGCLGLVLVPIIDGNHAPVVLAYVTFMLMVAALEAANQSPYNFPGLFGVCCFALFANVGAMGMFLFPVVLGTGLDAQYVIPIIGMVAGSALSGVSLGVSQIVTTIAERKEGVEGLLALGATRWEATRDVVRAGVKLGLIPTLNRMSVTGLVSIPGMMTGQIIGGTSPGLAARYQLVIMYAISGTTCSSVLTSALLTILILTDKEHRVRSERLTKRRKGMRILAQIWQRISGSQRARHDENQAPPASSQSLNSAARAGNGNYGATSGRS